MAEILDVLKTAKITREAIYETESLLTNDLLIWELKDEATDRAMALGYIQGINDFAKTLVERLEL